MIRAIDVSHYQRDVDWARLFPRYGLAFGMAKCTEGTSFFDSYYLQNQARVHALGEPFVAYHYATPSASSAATQARYFVGKAGQVDALCLDLEKSKLNQAQTAEWKNDFGDELRQLSDVSTICYLGGYSQNGSGEGTNQHFDFWMYPRYASTGPATVWPTSCDPRIDANTTGFPHPPAPHIHQWTPNLAGMDASVSDLTVQQLFGGDPLAGMTLDDIAHAVWAYDQDGAPGKAQAWAYLQNASNDGQTVSNILTGADPAGQAAFFAALVKALPPSQGGAGPTAQEIADAVAVTFATRLGGTT